MKASMFLKQKYIAFQIQGLIPLRIVEVQCGSYLEEDDIVRIDDNYGRS